MKYLLCNLNVHLFQKIMNDFEASCVKFMDIKASRMKHYADLWYQRRNDCRNIRLSIIIIIIFVKTPSLPQPNGWGSRENDFTTTHHTNPMSEILPSSA